MRLNEKRNPFKAKSFVGTVATRGILAQRLRMLCARHAGDATKTRMDYTGNRRKLWYNCSS